MDFTNETYAVSNQLISLTSREMIATTVQINQVRFQSINFPNE